MMNYFSSDFRTKVLELVDMMKNTHFKDHDDIRQSWSKIQNLFLLIMKKKPKRFFAKKGKKQRKKNFHEYFPFLKKHI